MSSTGDGGTADEREAAPFVVADADPGEVDVLPSANVELARAAAEPTLDILMRRDPLTLTDEDRRTMVQHLRADRARWVLKGEKRKEEKDE